MSSIKTPPKWFWVFIRMTGWLFDCQRTVNDVVAQFFVNDVLALNRYFLWAWQRKYPGWPAGTGEVEVEIKVLDLDFGGHQNRRVAARQPPYFLSKPTKSRQKMAATAWSMLARR
jgi:hypothetical protein